jgi:intracellular septation protein A
VEAEASPRGTVADTPEELEAIRRDLIRGDASGASRSLLKSVAPRLLRDILGPTLLFYAGWKISNNIFIGIGLGTAFALGAWQYERRHGRPGVIARFVLAIVVVQAVVGVATGSATAYLIQPAALGVINGIVWLGSVAIGKPLAGLFAHEVFPVDDEMRASPEFRAVFRHVSLLFGLFFLIFAAIQITVLLIVGVGAFVAVRVADLVCTLGMVVYCLRYLVRHIDLSKVQR